MNRHIERREVPGEGNIVMREAHRGPTSSVGTPGVSMSQNFYVGHYLQGL